jgi:hypothetical protein
MHGHALVAVILLALSGPLRPLHWRARGFAGLARVAPGAEARPNTSPAETPMSLNAIELALVAEHSLEMARAHQAVADDATSRPEARRKAAEVAAAWRQRAELFQIEARRRSAQPIVPGVRPIRPIAGPERRSRMRRKHTRRTDRAAPRHGPRDRRAVPDRRRRDRRGAELVPR